MFKGAQIGAIVYGSGINHRDYIDDAKRRGLVVVLCDGYCEVWTPAK